MSRNGNGKNGGTPEGPRRIGENRTGPERNKSPNPLYLGDEVGLAPSVSGIAESQRNSCRW